MLDIVIPSKGEELFLHKTILDVVEKSSDTTHIYPVLDGSNPPIEEIIDHPRVHYIRFPPTDYAKKRQAINLVSEMGRGEFIMSLDAHCMVDKGFDEILQRDHQWNWVQIPRRHRLDAANWCLQDQADSRPPIDYEYTMWPLQPGFGVPSLHGFKWDERTLERKDIPIDDTMHIQGSCWFMTKEWFKRCGFMDLRYQGWGQEGEEIAMTTYYNGGSVKTNKNTWYAHLHKGKTYGRMYHLSLYETRASSEFAYNYWVKDHHRFFVSFINKFWPIPGWPEDWEKQLYGS